MVKAPNDLARRLGPRRPGGLARPSRQVIRSLDQDPASAANEMRKFIGTLVRGLCVEREREREREINTIWTQLLWQDTVFR